MSKKSLLKVSIVLSFMLLFAITATMSAYAAAPNLNTDASSPRISGNSVTLVFDTAVTTSMGPTFDVNDLVIEGVPRSIDAVSVSPGYGATRVTVTFGGAPAPTTISTVPGQNKIDIDTGLRSVNTNSEFGVVGVEDTVQLLDAIPTISWARITGGNELKIKFSEVITTVETPGPYDFSDLKGDIGARNVTGVSGSGTDLITINFDGAAATNTQGATVDIAATLVDASGYNLSVPAALANDQVIRSQAPIIPTNTATTSYAKFTGSNKLEITFSEGVIFNFADFTNLEVQSVSANILALESRNIIGVAYKDSTSVVEVTFAPAVNQVINGVPYGATDITGEIDIAGTVADVEQGLGLNGAAGYANKALTDGQAAAIRSSKVVGEDTLRFVFSESIAGGATAGYRGTYWDSNVPGSTIPATDAGKIQPPAGALSTTNVLNDTVNVTSVDGATTPKNASGFINISGVRDASSPANTWRSDTLDRAVTDGWAPALISADITEGNTITLVYDEVVNTNFTDYGDLQLAAGGPRGVTLADTGSDTILINFLGDPAAIDEIATIDIGQGSLTSPTDLAGNALADLNPQAVGDGQAPLVDDETVEFIDNNTIRVVFEEDIDDTTVDPLGANFTNLQIPAGTPSVATINNVAAVGALPTNTYDVNYNGTPFGADDEGTINIDGIDDIAGNTMVALVDEPVGDGQTASVTAAPSTPDLNFADDKGKYNNDNITNQTTGLTFTGTTAVGTVTTVVTVYDVVDVDGSGPIPASPQRNLGNATVNGTDWIMDAPASPIDEELPDGVHTITAVTTADGNVSGPSNALTLYIDITRPAWTSTGAPENQEINETGAWPITFTLEAADSSGFAYTGKGMASYSMGAKSGYAYFWQFGALIPGKDAIPPNGAVTIPSTLNGVNYAKVGGEDDKIAAGGAIPGYIDNRFQITYNATDLAGNTTSSYGTSKTIEINDETTPNIVDEATGLAFVAQNVDEGDTLALTLSNTDDVGDLLRYEFLPTEGGDPIDTSGSDAVGKVSFDTSSRVFKFKPNGRANETSAGNYVARFRITDRAGLTSTADVTINVADTAPLRTTTRINYLRWREVRGTVTDVYGGRALDSNGTIEVYRSKVSGTPVATGNVSSTGTFRVRDGDIIRGKRYIVVFTGNGDYSTSRAKRNLR